MARDSKVIIRLTDEIKEEFQSLADEYGMTISALGSYVIGKYIQQERRGKEFQKQMVQPTVETMTKMAGEQIDPQQLSHFFKALGNIVTIDGEVTKEEKKA